METLEAIRTRKSVRSFLDQGIPEEVITQILEAGTRAPSGGNMQPWRFVVATDRDKIAQFDPEFNQPWVEKAPAIIVACVNPHDTWASYDEDDHFYIFDVAAAIENMLLAIHDLGLGGVWVLSCAKKRIRHLLEIPAHWLIVSIIPFGYYREDGEVEMDGRRYDNITITARKPLSEVAFMNNAKTPFLDTSKHTPLDRPRFNGP